MRNSKADLLIVPIDLGQIINIIETSDDLQKNYKHCMLMQLQDSQFINNLSKQISE